MDGKNTGDLGSALGHVVHFCVILGRSPNLSGHQTCHMNIRTADGSHLLQP